MNPTDENPEPGIHIFAVAVDDVPYLIKQLPSIYTRRNNAYLKLWDITIWHSPPGQAHGAKEDDGLYYTTIRRIACESGETISHYAKVPDFILSNLKQWGFTVGGEA